MFYNNLDDIDCVVHLSAIAGIKQCEDMPLDALRENVTVSERVFSWCKKTIFVSSQAAKSPTNVYALTKSLAEKMADYWNKRNGDIRVLRLSNVYGGKKYIEDKSSVVAKFMRARKDNRPVTINGSGMQERDFVHIEDVCEAIYLAIEREEKINNPIDIGTGKATAIIELAEMFEDLEFKTGGKGTVGVDSNIANNLEAKRLLGFESKKKLEEYIKENEQKILRSSNR
jgi:nucleoside-diphosphate-sugar epimerase